MSKRSWTKAVTTQHHQFDFPGACGAGSVVGKQSLPTSPCVKRSLTIGKFTGWYLQGISLGRRTQRLSQDLLGHFHSRWIPGMSSFLKYYLFVTTSTQELSSNPAAQPRGEESLGETSVVKPAFKSVPDLLGEPGKHFHFRASVSPFCHISALDSALQTGLQLLQIYALRVQAFSMAFASSDFCWGQREGKSLQY